MTMGSPTQFGANGNGMPYMAAKTPTKSDTVNETAMFRGVYIGSAGNVSVNMQDGIDAIFLAPPIGTILPVCGNRINSTNTTVATLLILY